MTLEELCRLLLRQAIDDGLVYSDPEGFVPEDLSAGDLAGMANLLNDAMGKRGNAAIKYQGTLRAVGGREGIKECLHAGNDAPLNIVLDDAEAAMHLFQSASN